MNEKKCENVYTFRPFIALLNKIFWSKITVPKHMIQKIIENFGTFKYVQILWSWKNNDFHEFERCPNTLSVPILTYIIMVLNTGVT